ncbi:sensor histidine kinase [Paenibacillus mucilaginosus]|uniref:sensor histidine kinase n=1 Tax=Paenibacillus mucilaginosus TaxID=61624 RepID=UPI0005A2CEA5|nr:sensor histidine kinase [Paenibacillus mucilaginosus]MCG7216513.1 sensor histidine kinase [Paenibacillus mucilaginosus]WDM31052.1 sensor histidine kinase [Paenibacillus mucilaginosus]
MITFSSRTLRSSIFARLLFTYVIVIAPILALGGYLYQWSYTNASEELSRTSITRLSHYLQDLNRELSWMELQQFDILEDPDLNKLTVTWERMDPVDRRASLNDLLQRLTSVKNTSAYIKDISVHIPYVNKTVSAVHAVDELDQERFGWFRSQPGRNESRLIWWRDSLHLSALKQRGKKGEEPLFAVQIELDMEKLRESLLQIRMNPESGSFLVSDGARFTVTSGQEAAPVVQSYLREARAASSDTFYVHSEGKNYHFDRVYSDALGLSAAAYLPEEAVRRPLSRFYTWAWLFVFTSLVAVAIYSFSTYRYVHKPLLILVKSFKRMEEGELDMQIEHEPKDEFGYLYHRFNQMLLKLQALIDQDYKQKLMMQKAELKQLQSQINPHFLYNSFFILHSLSRSGDIERIEQFTHMLGEYFRFITRNGEDHVSLSEEIRHSRMYTDIQQFRFSRRIRVQFDELPEAMEQIRVPRLILQPIIENAYEHGLEEMDEEGFLRVCFETHGNEARIIVEDNGDGITPAEIEALKQRLVHTAESEMTGMINIHRRIHLTYGEGSGLFLSQNGLKGLRVEIRIMHGEEGPYVPAADCG